MIRKWAQVLVLLLIAGVVVGLIAGFVQRIRQEAAKLTCQERFRLLAIALENYHDANDRFPPGTIRNADLPIERRLSWQLDAWSYAEAHMIGHERSGAWDAEGNRAIVTATPFRCPSNPERRRADGVGLTHFVGIAGLGSDAPLLQAGHRAAGVFGYDRATRKEDIRDGLATTVVVMETTTRLGPWLAGGPSTVRGLDPDGPTYLDRDGQFGSYHVVGDDWRPGGAHACFADGSVRPLARDIDSTVLEALVTMAGGEEVSPPW
jgi:prepilin-type processing-associated H-X9-DG protein